MDIRTSKALKFFAILLFSFEMIAPAVISFVCIQDNSQSQQAAFYSNNDHSANLMSSLLCEESNGEEEQITFEYIEAPSIIFATEFRKVLRIEPREIISSRPPLFTLFHTYII